VVAGDILYSFSPVCGDGPEHHPAWYHQFHTYFGDRLIQVGQPANANGPVSNANYPAYTGLPGRDGQSPNRERPASTGKTQWDPRCSIGRPPPASHGRLADRRARSSRPG
jgi:hypothetical protein